MNTTVYARIEPGLKQATDEYAETRGMSLASAVADLLARGLKSASEKSVIPELETRNRELEAEVARVRQVVSTMDARLQQVLGECQCGGKLTGRDLLIEGRCPRCHRGVTGLLTGTAPNEGSVNRTELGPFMAGIGVALAIVLLAYAVAQE